MKYLMTTLLIFGTSLPSMGQEPVVEYSSRYSVFVRIVAFRVAPGDVPAWEKAVQGITAAARKSRSDKHEWWFYREGACDYWLILFANDFPGMPTEASFDRDFRETDGESEYRDALAALLRTDFEVIRDTVCQQVLNWSTVKSMDFRTHPKARIEDFWVKPGGESAFDVVQQRYASLLKEIKYPYPVEGFYPRFGAPRVHQAVTFPDNWSDYFGPNNMEKWARDAGKHSELEQLLEQRARLILRASYHDLDFVRSMSYVPEDGRSTEHEAEKEIQPSIAE